MTIDPVSINSCVCGAGSHRDGTHDASDPAFWLTPDQVVAYVRGAVTLGTLRNYRSARIGPRHLKVGRSIFYTVESVHAWLADLAADDELRWNDRL